MKKTIGIIGGMGPMATADLFRKIIELEKAPTDQEYNRIVIDSNTNIPDRTAAILQNGQNPVPEMVASALRLENMGADVLGMSCNTAHYFYDEIVKFIHIPLVNMLKETAKEVKKRGFHKVGLLATDGTIQSGVYKREFEKLGVEIALPSPEGQKMIMDVIYNVIKAGKEPVISPELQQELDELLKNGAQTLILGCTELPLLFEGSKSKLPYIDPTTVLAQALIDYK